MYVCMCMCMLHVHVACACEWAGDDYIEMGINSFRFAFLTKKGVSMSLPRTNEMVLQAGVTIEGREDDELPEQMIAVAYVKHLDLTQGSTEI